MRVLAIRLEDELFDELKAHIKEKGQTMQDYMSTLVSNTLKKPEIDLVEPMAPEMPPGSPQESPTGDNEGKTNKWDRDELVQAIDNFMTKNNRIPTQKEFRSDNGLSSYSAAQRNLGQSPSEYCNKRFEELTAQEQGETNMGFGVGV